MYFAKDFTRVLRQCRRKVVRSIRVLETSDSDGRYYIHCSPQCHRFSGTLRFRLEFVFNVFRESFTRVLRQCRRKVVRSIRVLETSDSDGRYYIYTAPLSVTGLRDAEVSTEFVFECISRKTSGEYSGSVGVKLFEASESWKPVTLMGGIIYDCSPQCHRSPGR